MKLLRQCLRSEDLIQGTENKVKFINKVSKTVQFISFYWPSEKLNHSTKKHSGANAFYQRLVSTNHTFVAREFFPTASIKLQ